MAGATDELIPTQTTLLERIKDLGDDSSWQEFFETYRKLIYGMALKSRLTDMEAQDVVQETMFSVAKHIPSFKYDRTIGSFKRWLLNMTRWRIMDQFRRRENVAVSNPTDTSVGTQLMDQIADPLSADLDALWEAEWQKVVLQSAIIKVKRRLEPEKYQIFDLLVNKEWPPQKVADNFGISIDRVYLSKHRIIELIKKEADRLRAEMG